MSRGAAGLLLALPNSIPRGPVVPSKAGKRNMNQHPHRSAPVADRLASVCKESWWLNVPRDSWQAATNQQVPRQKVGGGCGIESTVRRDD